MRGKAQAAAGRHFLAPACGVACCLDHPAKTARVDGIARRILAIVPDIPLFDRVDLAGGSDHLQQVIAMIAPRLVRQFGDKRLDREGMGDVGHRPIPADPGMGLCLRVLGPHVRDVEGHIGQPHAQLEGQLLHGVGREDRADGRRRRAVKPGDRAAVLVQPGLQAFDRNGVIEAVMQVVLARPGHLDGRAVHFPAEDGSLQHEVRLGLAAEAATQQGHVHRDVLGIEAQLFGHPDARDLRRLHAGPDLAFAVADHRQG